MKILKINFKNIHSLKGEHQIDFSDGAISEAGLFLISGPTGSGKSTLLDVITLALYNRIPRIDGKITNNTLLQDGGIMTRNASNCYAEVEYRINQITYRSNWSIERNRNNNLKQRRQELVNVITDNILDSGTSVPDKNEEIIGLSYDQFIKAMVLSQGQFSKLLKASRDDRNKLLEDITGAGIYREIGRAVFGRYRECKRKREDQETRIKEIKFLSDEDLQKLQEDLKGLEADKPSLEEKYNKTKQDIDIRKAVIDKTKIHNENLDEKNKLEKAFHNFKEQQTALNNHNRLVQHRDLLNEAKQNTIILKEINQEITSTEQNINKSVETKSLLKNDIQELIGDTLPEKDLINELDKFKKKVTDLQSSEKTAEFTAQTQKNNLASVLKDLGLKLLDNPDLISEEILEKKTNFRKTIAESEEEDKSVIVEKILKLREDVLKTEQLKNKVESYVNNQNTYSKKEKEFTQGKKTLAEYYAHMAKLEKDIDIVRPEVEKLTKQNEERKRVQSLEEHRHELVDGEPCPLCGSQHHPYASDLPKYKDQAQELLDTKKSLLISSENNLISLRTNITNQENANKKDELELIELKSNIQRIFNEIKELCKKLEWDTITDVEAIDENTSRIKHKLDILEKAELALNAIKQIKQADQFLKEWKDASDNFQQAKIQREQLYSGQDIEKEVGKIKDQWTSLKTNIQNFQQHLEKQTERQKEISQKAEEFDNQLNQILAKEGIETVGRLRQSILPEEKAEAIRKTYNSLKERESSLMTALKLNLKELNMLKEKDDDQISIETLEHKYNEAKDARDESLKDIGIITEKLEADKNEKAKHENAIKTLDALKNDEALWKTMTDLVGDSTGKKFSNFVQDLTLKQLIVYTNKRLMDFSDRYILDNPTETEAEKNDSLKVFDTYMGDVRRSVNTLSGGETFMLSLAMAFALSDLASRNVQIESVFIDEGFGTLDAETLDQAISILEKMQNDGNKLIGIISHVEALKERITTQIKLKKSGAGFSTIDII